MIIDFIVKKKKLIGDIIIAAVLILLFSFDSLVYFEHKLQDLAYHKPELPAQNITVFGIDIDALSEFGIFQDWSRQKIADAINILNSGEEKPAVIAIDVLFVSESSDREADENLAKAIEDSGNVVLASLINYDREWAGMLEDFENAYRRTIIKDYEIPYASLAENAPYGFVNAIYSSGSIIREAQFKTQYDGELIYSFPVEIYKMYMESIGEDTGEVDDYIARYNTSYITYSTTLYEDAPGEYFGWSLADIFDEDLFDEDMLDLLAGEIILIGPYAPALEDSYLTPVSQSVQMYGVEIHANVVNMLIKGNFKQYVSQKINIAVSVLLVALLLFVIIRFIKDIRILLGVFAVLGAGYYFSALFIFGKGYIITLIYPLFSLVIIYIYQVVYGYILEAIEKRKLKSAFKKYVDPKLVDKLVESGEANSNEVGVKKNIAVLFVDVRGFTPMTEALKDQSELVVKILNEYLELTSSSVFNNGGSVDKFVGDATMALFNGFFPTDDYVFKAVKAAWDMVQGAVAVNASIKEKYGVDVGFGIGVNCGDAIVGNLGPSFRKDYTAIGDTVNTAARLESNAKRSEVLISREVYDIVKDRIEADSVGEIPLKGKSIKLEVFSVQNIMA